MGIMKTPGIRGVWFALFVVVGATADTASPPAGEVVLSQSFLNQFQMSGRKTQPFVKRGNLMHPDITLKVSPSLGTGADGAQLALNVDMEGWSTTHSSRRVIFGNTVNVTVASHIDADYKKDLVLKPAGLTEGALRGAPTITPHIYTSNTFRKPRRNRKVNGIAYSTAASMVGQQLPREKAELDAEISHGVEAGVDAAKEMVHRAVNQASVIAASAKNFPFESQISSEGGPAGQLHMKLVDKGESKKRSAPPKLDKAAQAASQVTIHADLLAETIIPEIAGKEMFLVDLKNYLCGPKTKGLLDFCKQEMPDDQKKLSIVFAEAKDKPIEFFFEKGKIGIRLNAVYRQTEPEQLPADRGLLNDADREGVKFQTVPYSVDIAYKLSDGGATLDTLTVRDRGSKSLLETAAGFFGLGGDHAGSEKKSEGGRDTLAAALSPVIRATMEEEFKKTFKDQIVFPTVSFPTKMDIPGFSGTPGTQPKITEAGSLVPLDAKAEDGWLVIANAYCSEGLPALGVTVQESSYVSGGYRYPAVAVSGLYPGSPAALSGMRAGDRIESFGPPGERASTVLNGKREPLLTFLAEKARGSTPGARTVEISGRDSAGKPFKRSVSLCPSQLKHRELAQKTLAAAKTAAR
jgi:hypothetical protein